MKLTIIKWANVVFAQYEHKNKNTHVYGRFNFFFKSFKLLKQLCDEFIKNDITQNSTKGRTQNKIYKNFVEKKN